jgi:hypothetical protein
MYKFKLLSALVLGCGVLAFAGETPESATTPSPDRTDNDVVRVEIPATTDPSVSEPISTRLDPRIAQIEATYRTRMQALKSQIGATADPVSQDQLQQQAGQLKIEWTLALADRQLELARERKDSRAEAELLQAIERIQHPRTAPAPAAKGGAR